MAQSSAKLQTTWDEILGEIRKNVQPQPFNQWLRPTRQEGLAQGTLTISVPDAERSQVGEKFRPQIEQAIQRLRLQHAVQRVEVVVVAGSLQ
ncbi:MAG: DnaA N-terminal domain-containing protein, partial [Terriglobales bacterium]